MRLLWQLEWLVEHTQDKLLRLTALRYCTLDVLNPGALKGNLMKGAEYCITRVVERMYARLQDQYVCVHAHFTFHKAGLHD